MKHDILFPSGAPPGAGSVLSGIRKSWAWVFRQARGALLPVLFAGLSTAAQTPHLTFATCEFPPYYSAGMPGAGPISEIITEAYNRMGYRVEIQFYPWARALALGEHGAVDGLVGVWHSKERERWFLFSNPLPGNEIILMKVKGKGPERFTTMEALKPFRIGTVRGYANPPGFDTAGLQVEEVTDDLQNLRKLYHHRIDLVLIDKGVGRYLVSQKMPEAAASFEELDPALEYKHLYLVIPKKVKNASQLLETFNQGLALLTKEGTVKTILARHGLK